MKKFIFGVMLLVSMLGIVGCANPSNSDGSENVVYTLKNGLTDSDSNPISMTISYKNKSGVWTNEQTIPFDGTYEIPANDAKIGVLELTDLASMTVRKNPVIYVKINNKDDCCIYLSLLKIGVYKVSGVGKYGDLNIVLGLNE